ncbi:hypothetical protein J2X65_004209 [Ancylobacter sp. 3268]|uniref:hypothetical protein n=1 Tax=Ancylobacter sp. 3268 TaxID=2817752 RepID=UPI002865F14B|nr:hypothetical protein [Ancylobacter sp. 3268]MDR6954833.1 hypothetical protein [Ancylobacter sp. 3268]
MSAPWHTERKPQGCGRSVALSIRLTSGLKIGQLRPATALPMKQENKYRAPAVALDAPAAQSSTFYAAYRQIKKTKISGRTS